MSPSITVDCETEAPLSAGESQALYPLIQSNFTSVYTWRRLWHAWGLCQRHACGLIATDAAFRNHSTALLYADLLQRAQHAMQVDGPLRAWRLAWRLRDQEPCLLCEAGVGPHSHNAAAPALPAHATDLSAARAFAAHTRPFWQETICGRCLGTCAEPRCRLHLRADLRKGASIDLSRQQRLVATISHRAGVHARAFRWDARGSETESDQAAVISAVGWCSGWKALLVLAAGPNDTAAGSERRIGRPGKDEPPPRTGQE
jgi:hypothetical protein